jgi:hypothetical protein
MLAGTMVEPPDVHDASRALLRVVALLLLAATAIAPGVDAAPPSVCHSYATNAVAQQATNNFQDCGFGGDRWSANFNGHYDWCLGQSEGTLEFERAGRQADLDKCTMCVGYANEAVGAQQQNVDSQCGYQGDPWSFNRRDHLRWCIGAPQSSIDQETNHRRGEIGKCSHCVGYANRAVDAQRYNLGRDCRYSGDRWSEDYGAHFRWCTSVPLGGSQAEDAARNAERDKCASCVTYAADATTAQRRNLQEQCGFSGDRWSEDDNGHFHWCVGAPQYVVDRERWARSSLLDQCAQCQRYVDGAIADQAENEARHCGLTGDRWSRDRGHHAAWCAVVSWDATRSESATRRSLLVQCVLPGKKEACRNYASTAVSQNAESRALGCGFTGNAWSDNRAGHYEFCLMVNASQYDEETRRRERDLTGCRAAQGRPQPQSCNVSVVVRTKECRNQDGSQSQYLEPGSTSAVGCAADEDTAETRAKQSLSTQTALSDGDEPAPGTCTYEKEAAFAGCLCPR